MKRVFPALVALAVLAIAAPLLAVQNTEVYFAVPTGSYDAQFPVQPAQELGRIEPGRQSISVYRMVGDYLPPIPESPYKVRAYSSVFRALEGYVRARNQGETAWILTLKDETTLLVTRKR